MLVGRKIKVPHTKEKKKTSVGKSGNRKTTTPPLKCFHTQLIPVGKEKKECNEENWFM